MDAHSLLKSAFATSHYILTVYLKDLEEKDIMISPVEGMNPIAWQLGHLIINEHRAIEGVRPGSAPDLPDGFEQNHSTAALDRPGEAGYLSIKEYLKLFEQLRGATMKLIESLTAEDLDAPAPEHMRHYARTAGDALLVQAIHETQHAGQFVAVRKLRNKPVVI